MSCALADYALARPVQPESAVAARALLDPPPVTEIVTKTYYYAGASLIAMRVLTGTTGNTLYYTHSDHLGSTSLTTDVNGVVVARQYYYPYGGIRPGPNNALPTEIGFTGQQSESAALGSLMYFKARFYSPLVGRFLSADTLVPGIAERSGGGAATLAYDERMALAPLTVDFHEPAFLAGLTAENTFTLQHGFWFQLSDEERQKAKIPWGPQNPLALNRYAYVLNNPLKYTDPTGHCFWDACIIEIPLTTIAVVVGGIVLVGIGVYQYAISPNAAENRAALGASIEAVVEPAVDQVRILMARKADIKDIDRIANKHGLTREQRRRLHDEITGRDLTLEEIEGIAEDIANAYGHNDDVEGNNESNDEP